jgi:chemotaxis signal transduction protein
MNNHHERDSRTQSSAQDRSPSDAAIARLLDRPLAAEDLQAATDRVARPLEPPQKDVVRLLVFRAGNERLALKVVDITKVTGATTVRRIPHRSNKIIRGLCNVDGDLLLCGDLGRLLELGNKQAAEDETSDRRRMIVIGREPDQWVVEVDAVEGMLSMSPDVFRDPPITVEASLARYTSSLLPLDDGMATLLDVGLLASGFQAALA